MNILKKYRPLIRFLSLIIAAGLILSLASCEEKKGNSSNVYSKSLAKTRYEACKNNLIKIGSALELYASEHDGHYPATLGEIHPKYVTKMLLCPEAGKDTYSPGYKVSPDRNKYTLCCAGHNHKKAGKGENMPEFISGENPAKPNF